MNSKYFINDLEWDTKYFEIPSVRVNLNNELNEKDIDEILLQTKKYKFITIYNYNNNDYNNYLLKKFNNIFLADVNVHFEKKCNSVDGLNKKVKICNNLAENKSILEIAQKSFLYSRFINDKNLNSKKSSNIYYYWVKNSFEKEEKYFCIYESIGFLLFSVNNIEKNATIELIAVNNDFKGKNVGTDLIKSFENYCYNIGIKKLMVGTQLNNIIAQNFYQKNGYKITQYNSIYHYWNGEN